MTGLTGGMGMPPPPPPQQPMFMQIPVPFPVAVPTIESLPEDQRIAAYHQGGNDTWVSLQLLPNRC